jgi:uncharacterized protein YqhQ
MLRSAPSEAIPRPYVGGQAIIEGVFMRAPRALAMAVRLPTGAITTQAAPYTPFYQRHKAFRLPFIRGAFVMIDALVVGMKALSWSAEQAAIEDGESPEPTERPERAPLKDRLALGGTMAFSLVLGIGLFVALPHLLTDGLGWLTGTSLDVEGPAFHLIDGAVKLAIFLAYIALIRRSSEILRVFAYHGAEHKTIYAYEAGLPLELEQVRAQSRFHPRCGTSFILFVVGISILVFAAVFPLLPELGIEQRLLKNLAQVGIKVPLTLPVAAVSYEIIRLSGKLYDKAAFFRWLARPGLALQRLTTEEPDDQQLEVAITALTRALAVEQEQGETVLGLEGEVFSSIAARG